MNKCIDQKTIEKLLSPYNQNGKQAWVVISNKKIPMLVVEMALNLLNLEFIKYVRICNTSLAASSENEHIRMILPVTKIYHPLAIGIRIIYDPNYKIIDFVDINSPIPGNGTKMVDAVFKDFPKEWQPTVSRDISNGFWDKMKKKHHQKGWII